MAAKETEALVTGTDNAADAAAARKAKALPFGGRLDPYKHIDDTTLPAYMPKRGQASDVRGPRTEQRPMTHVEAAKALRDKFSADGLTDAGTLPPVNGTVPGRRTGSRTG